MPNDLHGAAVMPCPACDFPPFTRNAYWTGKLMLARDFVDEQRYVVEKLRHHNQALHGWGTVCGLKVVPHSNPACRDRFVCVEPGTAVDCCGHDIVVREKDCLDLWSDPKIKALKDANDTATHALQICIKYRECESEPIPVLYDECGCDDDKCAPNRVLESYELHVLVDPKPSPAPPAPPAQCGDLWKTSVDGCPHCDQPDCIVLATIANYKIGNQIVDAMPSPVPAEGAAVIDNLTDRHILPSTQLIKEVIDCILQQGGGGSGTPGKGIDAVAATFVPCTQPGSAAIDETGPQRTLKLVIPKGCDGKDGGPGLDDVNLEIVDCNTPKYAAIEVDSNTGKRTLHLRVPSECEQDLVRICAISWVHVDPLKPANERVTSLADLKKAKNRIMLAFTGEVFNGDIHRHSFMVLARHRNDADRTDCWCELPVRQLSGVHFKNDCKLEANPTVLTKPTDMANGLIFEPAVDWRPNSEYRVVLKGDYIRDEKKRAIDADHLPPWLPTATSGDGIGGGTFESWFLTSD